MKKLKCIAYLEQQHKYIVWGIGKTPVHAMADAKKNGYKPLPGFPRKMLTCQAKEDLVEHIQSQGGFEVPMTIGSSGVADLIFYEMFSFLRNDMSFIKDHLGPLCDTSIQKTVASFRKEMQKFRLRVEKRLESTDPD